MRYTSTRSNDIDCSFEEALTSGYAADGGLFVPRTLPVLTTTLLNEWSNLSYPALMQQFMRLFISSDEVTDGELQTVCEAALAGFDDPRHAVPIVPMVVGANNINETSFFVSELFHGPTFCFKDLGMRAVVQLLSLFATKRNRPITLLVSTTGDTGPAAVQAVADNHPSVGGGGNPKQQLLKLLVHYPHKQISNFQRLQLTTVASPCVQVVAFEGGGDDMDEPIKQLLASKKTTRPAAAAGSNDTTTTNNNNNEDDNKTSLWTGVNSYNIVRICTVTAYFVLVSLLSLFIVPF